MSQFNGNGAHLLSTTEEILEIFQVWNLDPTVSICTQPVWTAFRIFKLKMKRSFASQSCNESSHTENDFLGVLSQELENAKNNSSIGFAARRSDSL